MTVRGEVGRSGASPSGRLATAARRALWSRRFWRGAVVALAGVVLAFAGDSPGCAQDGAAPRIAAVRLGFDDKYKVGDWAPVWVTLAAGSEAAEGRLELTVVDGDGVEVTYVAEVGPPVRVAARQEATFLHYVKFGRVRSDLHIALRDARGLRAERVFRPGEFPQPLPASRELLLTLGGDAGVADAIRQLRRRSDEQAVAAAVRDPAQLPDDWRGYDSLDRIVVATSDASFLAQLTGARRDALVQWVRLGGRMILSVGVQGEAAFGPQGALADLAPGRLLAVTEVSSRRTGGLEAYIGAGERLGGPAGRGGDLAMAVLDEVRGAVAVSQIVGPVARPLIVEYPVGFGVVTLIAADLDREPLASWSERAKLVRRLLEGRAEQTPAADVDAARGKVSHVGYQDLAGQLRGALDVFPGVTPVAFSWVAAAIVLYMILIGPVDYFFLRRVARRLERTWITFPAIVAIACLAAWAAVHSLRANRLLANQLEIVDVDADSGLVRGTQWAHIYSPAMERFDVGQRPQPPLEAQPGNAGSLLTWQGLPGGGLGGMNSTAFSLHQARYRLVSRDDGGGLAVAPEGLPIPIRSTRSLAGRWWASAAVPQGRGLTALADGTLTGDILNPLTIPLRDCQLAYNHWSYRLPAELEPGARVALERRRPDGNLVWRLTQRRVGDDYKESLTPWNDASRDLPRIVEMLMWHEAAGGRGYTGLLHRYQGDVDLSSHLRAGRAVLLGRAESPAADLTLDGQALAAGEGVRRWTWYRIVLPVAVRE